MAYTPPTGSAANFSLELYTVPTGSAADFELAAVATGYFVPGWGVSGKVGTTQSGDAFGAYGIWQMRMTKRGKVPVKMRFYTPTNPRSVAQQANRTKFAAAMTAWGALTTGQKAEYTTRAKKRNMFGWGYFVREYYMSH